MSLNKKQKEVITYIVMKQLLQSSYWVKSERAVQRITQDTGVSRASVYRYIEIFKQQNILRSTDQNNVWYVDVTNIDQNEEADKD